MTVEEEIADLARRIAAAPTSPPVTGEAMLAALALDHDNRNVRCAAVKKLLTRFCEVRAEADKLDAIAKAATAFVDEQGPRASEDLLLHPDFASAHWEDLVRAVEAAGR